MKYLLVMQIITLHFCISDYLALIKEFVMSCHDILETMRKKEEYLFIGIKCRVNSETDNI